MEDDDKLGLGHAANVYTGMSKKQGMCSFRQAAEEGLSRGRCLSRLKEVNWSVMFLTRWKVVLGRRNSKYKSSNTRTCPCVVGTRKLV